MEVSKKQIVDGVSTFIENCLIPSSDGQMKLVLTMVKDSVRKGNGMLDKFLDNPMISSVIVEEDGMYDITRFVQVMKEAFEDSDSFPVIVPSIPVISPQERTLKITEQHFDKLVHYIQPETVSSVEDE